MLIAESARLILRTMTLSDAPFMLTLLNSDDFIRHIGDRGVRTVAQAENYLIEGPMDSYLEYGYGMYIVELKSTGEALGVAGLVKRPELADTDLGYALLPNFYHQGYATEAAQAVLKHSDELGINPLLAIVNPDNEASINLLKKLAFYFQQSISWQDEKQVLMFKRELEVT